MKIAFRADSSYLIGTGHIHRCVEIAKAFKRKKISSIFISSNFDGNINGIIKQNFNLFKISYPKKKLIIKTKLEILNDAKKTIFYVKKHKINYLFIDNYQLDLIWEKLVSKYCKIVLISDYLNRKTICDYIINYHLLYEDHKLNKFYLNKNCKRLVGPQYSIIKKVNRTYSHLNIKKKLIVVYMGGVDNKNYTSKIISVLTKRLFINYKILIIIGNKNLNKEAIIKQIFKHKNFSHKLGNKKNLYNFISRCSLSICNAGSFMYENLTVGNNLIVLPQSQLQQKICSQLSLAKLIIYFKKNSQINSNFILRKLKNSIKKDKSIELSSLYDGKGTNRIVEFFINLNSNMNCKLILAKKEDKFFLFNLLNNYEVVKNSITRKITDFQDHEKWFFKNLKSNLSKIYLLKFKTLKIGQVRLDKISKNKINITYAISNEFRENSYGIKMIKIILNKVSKGLNLIACVRKFNLPSRKIFNKIGFKPIISLNNKSIIKYSFKK